MRIDGDTIAGAVFITLIVSVVGLMMWDYVTDEYQVKEISTCTAYQKQFKCHVINGEDVFFCDTKEECNKKCDEMRTRN